MDKQKKKRAGARESVEEEQGRRRLHVKRVMRRRRPAARERYVLPARLEPLVRQFLVKAAAKRE